MTQGVDEAARVLSQVKRVIRTNYSSPPTHGGQTATTVLTTPELRALWEGELGQMRDRIKSMRRQLVEKIRALRADFDFSYIVEQRGMFSYSGLNREQVRRLREEYSIYTIDSGTHLRRCAHLPQHRLRVKGDRVGAGVTATPHSGVAASNSGWSQRWAGSLARSLQRALEGREPVSAVSGHALL